MFPSELAACMFVVVESLEFVDRACNLCGNPYGDIGICRPGGGREHVDFEFKPALPLLLLRPSEGRHFIVSSVHVVEHGLEVMSEV